MKVLILDDDNKISNMIKSLLEKYFSKSIKQIDTVSNVKEAIEAINAENYQLYLFDIHLGKETSFEIFNQIEKTKSKLIFITGHEKYAINAIKQDALDYILKPINIQEFKDAIEKAIHQITKEQKSGKIRVSGDIKQAPCQKSQYKQRADYGLETCNQFF